MSEEMQALELCTCCQPLDYYNTEMSHQPRGRQSAHPAQSTRFICYILYSEGKLIFYTTPPGNTEMYIIRQRMLKSSLLQQTVLCDKR